MSYTGWAIFIICLLSGGALFFSVCDISLRTFSSAKLHDAFKDKKDETGADILIDTSEKHVLACSLYRLICNLGIPLALLMLFARIRQDTFQMIDFILSLLISLAIFSLLGLAIPHALAKYAGESTLCRVFPFLKLFTALAWPIIKIFAIYDELVKRLAGITESTEEEKQEEKEEEFLTDLEKQKIDGVVDEEEQAMIENVLELADTTAGEILTPRTDIIAIDVTTDLPTTLNTITTAGHSRFPVYEENVDKIIGLVYAKDFLTEIGKDSNNFKISEKIREAYFVPETKPLRQLLHEFQTQKLHIAVVLDEYGGTAGIITLEDIIEELVGEIEDEYEETTSSPNIQIDADTIEIDARTYIDDLNDQFDIELPEDEDYDTVGGFVFSFLGYIPKTAEQFEYENLRFTITAAEARRIIRIRVQKLPEPEDA